MRVCSSREFQTVGAAEESALDAKSIVTGGCCKRRAEDERKVLGGW